MGTPGKAMIRTDGKRGLLSNGKVAVFDANGNCPECCEEGCEFCSGTTPETFEVVFSDIDGCCKPGVFFYRPAIGTWLTAAFVNGTHELVRSGPCTWSKLISNVGYSTYLEIYTCDTFFQNLSSATIGITLKKTANDTWTLSVSFTTTIYDDYGLYGFIFYKKITGQVAECDGDLAFTNDITDCSGGICQDGTATVGLP